MKRAHGQTPCELVVLTGKTSLRTDQSPLIYALI